MKSASVQRIFGEDKRGSEALNGLRIEQSMSDVGDQEILVPGRRNKAESDGSLDRCEKNDLD